VPAPVIVIDGWPSMTTPALCLRALQEPAGETPTIKTAASTERDERLALLDLASQLGSEDAEIVFLFLTSRYDLAKLAPLVEAALGPRVVGCTGAGLIGPRGLQRGGATAAALPHGHFSAQSHLIAPLSQCRRSLRELITSVEAQRQKLPRHHRMAAILLVDGMSQREEHLTAALYQSLGEIALVGGSAGDDLRFEQSHVYHGGKFHRDAALLLILSTPLLLRPLCLQHCWPSSERLVVTRADPEARIVYEINGEPAADAYASIVGLSQERLNPNDFSRHPLVLSVRGEHYIRSVQRVHADGSLKLYCAVEAGMILSVGEPADAVDSLEDSLSALQMEGGPPCLLIGFDSVLRRLQYEQDHTIDRASALLCRHHVVGFNSYGEQFNSIHVNQTLTGLAIGGGS